MKTSTPREKICLVCSKVFYRPKRYSDRQWERAKYCSIACRPKHPPKKCCIEGCDTIVVENIWCEKHRGRIRRHGDPNVVVVELHGQANTPEYMAWKGMIARCTNPHSLKWERYGGRGISIFPEWKRSFLSFLNAVGPRPTPEHSLDRINNDGNYEPGNVRWATRTEQQRNSSRNKRVLFRGEILPIVVISRRTGMDQWVLNARLKRGWDIERAVSAPVAPHRKHKIKLSAHEREEVPPCPTRS